VGGFCDFWRFAGCFFCEKKHRWPRRRDRRLPPAWKSAWLFCIYVPPCLRNPGAPSGELREFWRSSSSSSFLSLCPQVQAQAAMAAMVVCVPSAELGGKSSSFFFCGYHWWCGWFGLAVCVCRGEEGTADQLGALARLRGASGVAAAGGQPRRLLPPRPQRAGETLSLSLSEHTPCCDSSFMVSLCSLAAHFFAMFLEFFFRMVWLVHVPRLFKMLSSWQFLLWCYA
jgi:hypothetical protein